MKSKIGKKIKYFFIIAVIFSLYQFCLKIFVENYRKKTTIISRQPEIELLKKTFLN